MEWTIKSLQVKLYRIPLKETLVDSLHGIHTDFELVTVTLTAGNGVSGTGYTYTGGRGGHGIACLIDRDLRRYIVGTKITEPGELGRMLDRTLHYVGRGGILSFAISAVDIAMWDVCLKTQGIPLHAVNGRSPAPVKTYYGGIDLGYSQDKLLDSIREALDNGHNAVKIKVGKEDWREDVSRIRAVRGLLGPGRLFMIDANMVWTVEQALKVCREIGDLDILWLEEPLNPDDLMGYQKLADACPIPIATGENLHTLYEHKHAIEIGHVRYIQPDASNILGITGWLAVASLAKAHQRTVNPHGMQELHVNLMAAVDNAGLMEFHSFPIHEYITRTLEVKDGTVMPSLEPGVGVMFDPDKVDRYETDI